MADESTDRTQNIVIRANTGLPEEEIQRMVQEGEPGSEADRMFEELADAQSATDEPPQ